MRGRGDDRQRSDRANECFHPFLLVPGVGRAGRDGCYSRASLSAVSSPLKLVHGLACVSRFACAERCARVRSTNDRTKDPLRAALAPFPCRGAGRRPVQLARIAETQRVPPKYLELIMLDLKKAGLVKSARGPKGGYKLARSPDADFIRRDRSNDGRADRAGVLRKRQLLRAVRRLPR